MKHLFSKDLVKTYFICNNSIEHVGSYLQVMYKKQFYDRNVSLRYIYMYYHKLIKFDYIITNDALKLKQNGQKIEYDAKKHKLGKLVNVFLLSS